MFSVAAPGITVAPAAVMFPDNDVLLSAVTCPAPATDSCPAPTVVDSADMSEPLDTVMLPENDADAAALNAADLWNTFCPATTIEATADIGTAPWNIFSPAAVNAAAAVISSPPARYRMALADKDDAAVMVDEAFANRVPV